ncbi:hypothetical protein HYDPIDRAFT_44035 [Hydnomerulius pinastri MD-312]|uniref:Uncharacterized protein n=1 Tax=Hydnomerulius pinastri MD-312 TaxID=994086 RepID=A0A0C9W0H2_9AGAM|nr:hypothetical protein HYDPIDRAFT_44035 [Hydnomerulius pinastri MD-312]
MPPRLPRGAVENDIVLQDTVCHLESFNRSSSLFLFLRCVPNLASRSRHAKDEEVPVAKENLKALTQALRTVWSEIEGKFGGTKVVLRPPPVVVSRDEEASPSLLLQSLPLFPPPDLLFAPHPISASLTTQL